MNLWLIVWAVVVALVLVVPICYDADRRKLWIDRFLHCRWSAVVNETNTQEEEEYHYVLSRAQEDGIRESFLLDKLHHYTKDLAAQDIVHNATASTDDSSGDDDEAISDPEVGIHVIQDDDSAEEPARSSEAEPVHEGEAKGAKNDSLSDIPPTVPSSGDESGDDDVAEADEVVGEFIGDCTSQISVPHAGALWHDSNFTPTRTIPNGCAICLSTFVPNDKVTWSSNANCGHVFHHSCILNWLIASGRKKLKRSPRSDNNRVVNYAVDPVKRIIDFPMHCPCCRQDFIDVPPTKDEAETDKASESSDPAVLAEVSLAAGEENV